MDGTPPFACPRTRVVLRDNLYSTEAHMAYPSVDGVPILVADPFDHIGKSSIRRAAEADAQHLGVPDPLTPHLPPSVFSAPTGFGAWLAALGDAGPEAVCADMAAAHAPEGAACDVGCGVGVMARRMLAAGRPTCAFDINLEAVFLARGMLTGQLPHATIRSHAGGLRRVKVPFKPTDARLSFCVADAARPPFAAGAFAWVHLGDVLDACGDSLADVLVGSVEMLAPDGVLTLSTPYAVPSEIAEGVPPPEDELLEALAELGLTVVAAQEHVPRVVRHYDRSFEVWFHHCVAAVRT